MNETSACNRLWRWTRARFSLRGRASRREFWLTFPCAFAAALAGAVLIVAVYAILARASTALHIRSGTFIAVTIGLLVALDVVLYMWLCFAVSIRRTQDLGFSYRESFRIRTNIQGGFKRGTIGPNEYGPDPLQKGDAA